ncbi:MAG: hypothetical protein RSC68_00025 [Acinetobacter sp.]
MELDSLKNTSASCYFTCNPGASLVQASDIEYITDAIGSSMPAENLLKIVNCLYNDRELMVACILNQDILSILLKRYEDDSVALEVYRRFKQIADPISFTSFQLQSTFREYLQSNFAQVLTGLTKYLKTTECANMIMEAPIAEAPVDEEQVTK